MTVHRRTRLCGGVGLRVRHAELLQQPPAAQLSPLAVQGFKRSHALHNLLPMQGQVTQTGTRLQCRSPYGQLCGHGVHSLPIGLAGAERVHHHSTAIALGQLPVSHGHRRLTSALQKILHGMREIRQ